MQSGQLNCARSLRVDATRVFMDNGLASENDLWGDNLGNLKKSFAAISKISEGILFQLTSRKHSHLLQVSQ
jgi:hypothetical protein